MLVNLIAHKRQYFDLTIYCLLLRTGINEVSKEDTAGQMIQIQPNYEELTGSEYLSQVYS